MRRHSNGSAIWLRLWVNPSPGSSNVVGIEVSPHRPSSTLRQLPIPKSPGLSWSGVHKWHVPSILKLSKFSIFSPVLLAEPVTSFVRVNIVSSDWWSDCENTSSPAVVVTSVWVLVWDGDWWVVVVRSVNDFGMNNAENWQLASAWDIAFNWIAAITAESSCPAVGLDGPLLYLVSHTFFNVVEEVFVLFFTNLLCESEPEEQAQHKGRLVKDHLVYIIFIFIKTYGGT